MIERASRELGERYGLAVDPRARIWQLSVGEQQRVEILKALYRDARVLILDEPTAVLTPQEAEGLFATLRVMAAEGRTVIFISHKLHEVIGGRRPGHGAARRARRSAPSTTADGDEAVLAALMVGREVELARRRRAETRPSARSLLEAEGLTAARATAASTRSATSRSTVRAGEVLGVAGVAGNGQRELAEAITGLRPLARAR